MEAGRLRIELSSRDPCVCDILIREGLIQNLGSSIEDLLSESSSRSKKQKTIPSSVAIVGDSNTSRLFGWQIKQQLSHIHPRPHLFSFKAGEKSKNLATVERLAEEMERARIDRNSILLSLGGGVVGDVAGFIASIYKRGITYFQIPTTLLAQVDSSIGGKTGVDGAGGKNQLGTFYQPRAVLVDPNLLDSLPTGEIINGVAEIVKCAIIASREMFDDLTRINLFELGEIKRFIFRTCSIKAEVVSRDEREVNLRSILNFGHTVGHAIEAASSYALSHGTCVVLGMIAEAWIAWKEGILSEEEYFLQLELYQRLLPKIEAPRSGSTPLAIRKILVQRKKQLVALAQSDKKSSAGEIRMSLPKAIGRMASINGDFRIPITQELFCDSLEHLLKVL